MNRFLRLSLFLLLGSTLLACAPSRRPVPLGEIPAPKRTTPREEQYGRGVLLQLMQRWRLDYEHPKFQTLQTMVNRLTAAAGGSPSPWHLYLFRDHSFKNAAATRGNHIFVWTGILEETKSDDEIAAVLAHEISHVIAGHTDPDPEEELKKIFVNLGSRAAGVAVAGASRNPQMAQTAGQVAAGVTEQVGSGVLVYPYSRQLEHEADSVGMMLMAKGGYDPRAAITFWKRASRNPDFSSTIPFLSTHPPAADRMEKLQSALPLALRYYRGGYHNGSHHRGENPRREHHSTPKTSTPTNQTLHTPSHSDSFALPDGRTKTPNSANTQTTPASPPPADDSFDLNKAPARRSPSDTAQPNSPSATDSWSLPAAPTSWRVVGRRAVLFREPRPDSRPLGEFRRSTIVRARKRGDGWLEIASPERGFLKEGDLEPLPSPLPKLP